MKILENRDIFLFDSNFNYLYNIFDREYNLRNIFIWELRLSSGFRPVFI